MSGRIGTCTSCDGERPLTFIHSFPYPGRACGYLCATYMAHAAAQGQLPPAR